MAGGHGAIVLTGLAADSLAVAWIGNSQPLTQSVEIVATCPSVIGDGRYVVIKPGDADAIIAPEPVGLWAYDALRVAARQPRAGIDTEPEDTDHVLRLVHLDGSAGEPPPAVGAILTWRGQPVGKMGSSAQHYELGPIGLALVSADVPSGTTLAAGSTPVMVATD